MKNLTLYCLVPVLACSISSARAQEAQVDQVSAGHDFALQVCAACHVVARDQKTPPILKPPAPSFATIVRRKGLTETSLRTFLSSPHGKNSGGGKMPNPLLADFQIDKVVAYVLSLKKGK